VLHDVADLEDSGQTKTDGIIISVTDKVSWVQVIFLSCRYFILMEEQTVNIPSMLQIACRFPSDFIIIKD
jgi:hypothetical protein